MLRGTHDQGGVPAAPWRLAALLLAGVLFLSAAGAQELPGEKPTGTEISDVPWAPSPPRPQPKVIYGTDDRIDVYQESDPLIRTWAASTCALITSSRLAVQPDGSYVLTPAAYIRGGYPACPGEPFGDQPTAAFCTGFLVGPDLIATAGHCSMGTGTVFVFGWEMLDATTPRLTFEADRVYHWVETVSQSPSGDNDHQIVRVDRAVTAPGARPFGIRRSGVITADEPVGVIGHPAGLPMKIAFGPTTAVRSLQPTFFVANLDTYGGNSGSPVLNQDTGVLEGILVRGATDFLYNTADGCFYSNTLTDTGGRGEDCTKIAVAAAAIPTLVSSAGSVSFSRPYFGCEDTVEIHVTDGDLAGMALVAVSLAATGGDAETVALEEIPGAGGEFSGILPLAPGAPVPGDGTLQAAHGELLDALYVDADDGAGNVDVEVTAGAAVDCLPPIISGISVPYIGGTQATIRFTTDKAATPLVQYGTSCADLTGAESGPQGTAHEITLNFLTPETDYFFALSAEDIAGNTGTSDNGGACHAFTTLYIPDYLTEVFDSVNAVDLAGRMLTLFPDDNPNGYTACLEPAAHFGTDPGAATAVTLADDAFVQVDLTGGASVPFFGTDRARLFIGSNGYITFNNGDVSWRAELFAHFTFERIAPFMTDLNPLKRGRVSWAQLADRVVVTWENVPSYDSSLLYPPENSHSFQIEMMFDGVIRITWLNLFAANAVAGLSRGGDIPAGFEPTNLAGKPSCGVLNPDYAVPHTADTNQDGLVAVGELLRIVQFYNSGGLSCAAGTEDGFQPGTAGGTECAFHNADYEPADWAINLSELLRVVQFYNARGYYRDPYAEDGYRPKFDP
jgi:hypothetical protein